MGNGEWKERMNEFGARSGRKLTHISGEVRHHGILSDMVGFII